MDKNKPEDQWDIEQYDADMIKSWSWLQDDKQKEPKKTETAED